MKDKLLKLKNFYLNIWNSKLKVFFMLSIIFIISFIVVMAIVVDAGGIMHFSTDDILQYYPYISGLFTKIKEGSLSLYDTTLFGGSSFFSGVYYLPFDIFTAISFVLSFFMNNFLAYFITNFSRPLFGALLLFYVLVRKGMRPKTGFIVSLIYYVGGMTQVFFVFPVYLGISFYIPLAMLLIDLCVEKKGAWYLTLPIYTVLVVLYDFYIAYILLAFLVIYFLIEMHINNHYSFFGKNSFIKNKEFWIRFFEMLFFVLLGVAMIAIFILPSALYILNYSARNSGSYEHSLWFYQAYNPETREYELSLKHYFTAFLSYFIPNDPDRLMLKGNYKTDHTSFYLTNGGLLFLAYFFLTWNTKNNRLKFWVILLNLLYLTPICGMIFTFTTEPYVRWFFIPYMVNLYAMAQGMEHNNFELSKSKILRSIPMIILLVGFITLLYIYKNESDLWIDYTKADPLYNVLSLSGVIITSIYIILLASSLIITFITKKHIRIIKIVSPIVIIGEVLFASAIIYNNTKNASSWYTDVEDSLSSIKNQFKEKGYDNTEGYRMNIVNKYSIGTYNANTWIGDINFGKFFQSFYSSSLDVCMEDIYKEPVPGSNHWNRTYNNVYSLTNGALFNMKYIAVDKFLNLPWKYYDCYSVNTNGSYDSSVTNGMYLHELRDDYCTPFIVYDKAFTSIDNSNIVKMQYAALKYAYVRDPQIEDITLEKNEKKIKEYNLLQEYYKNGIEFIDSTTASNVINDAGLIYSKQLNKSEFPSELADKGYDKGYYIYNISNYVDQIMKGDVLEIYSNINQIRNYNKCKVYLYYGNDESGQWQEGHYNTIYLNKKDNKKPTHIMITIPANTNYSSSISLYSYSFDLYDNYINTQKQYKDKYFKLDGDTMYIECTMPNNDYNRIIKTAYAYSDEWKVQNENYNTIDVNGGFLGIVIPKDVTNVDIVLKYEPMGYYFGCKLSLISSIIYLTIAIPTIVVIIRKRNKKYEEDIDNSSLL